MHPGPLPKFLSVTRVVYVLITALIFPSLSPATPVNAQDLTELSIEELMDITITSASKRPQKLQETAAAVFVITQEDIRRSGATCIPEALRMVPGLEVARNSGNMWSISSRGRNFTSAFENRMLVLVDGRNVYTPFHGGTYWDEIDTVLEDIDRIEIIRGPGNSAWGSNAINGIINIITKDSSQTQGTLLTLGSGSHEKSIMQARYGGTHNAMNYRVYAKTRNRNAFNQTDQEMNNGWADTVQGGFRTDTNTSFTHKLTIQGDILSTHEGDVFSEKEIINKVPTVTARESSNDKLIGNIMLRSTRTISPTSLFNLQCSYDRTERHTTAYGEDRDTADIDLNQTFAPWTGHKAQWGLGYRYSSASFDAGKTYDSVEHYDKSNTLSGFIQDEIKLTNTVTVTLGSKFEYRDDQDPEIMPSARIMYIPTPKHNLWAAVSRAVRLPSFSEQETQLSYGVIGEYGNVPVVMEMSGNEDIKPEEVLSWEAGYRYLPTNNISLDACLFYTEYKNLVTVEFDETKDTSPPSANQPYYLAIANADNLKHGQSKGFELAVTWQAQPWWRLYGAYSYYKISVTSDTCSQDIFGDAMEYTSPAHQISVRSSWDLPHNCEFDCWVRYVSELNQGKVPEYTTMDLRFAWQPSNHLEFSIVGQNLLEPSHLEINSEIMAVSNIKIERSIYAQCAIRF